MSQQFDSLPPSAGGSGTGPESGPSARSITDASRPRWSDRWAGNTGPSVAGSAPGLVVIVIAALIGVGGVGVWHQLEARSAPLPEAVASGLIPAAPSRQVTVHVSGLVASPGLVSLAEGDRVADAIAAAGGLLPAADLRGVNLARPVVDGELVEITTQGAYGPGLETNDGLVHVNRADAAALESLPGVGPVLAERIVKYRDEHGPFASEDDLLAVPGIGESKLETMRPLIRVP